MELKEKSKNAEETGKLSDETINENKNGNNITNEKPKDENLFSERNGQFNELKRRYGLKRYRIQEVIKPNQILLVQILKDERNQKGAALTTFISLAGKYSVLMPNTAKGGGISRKIFISGDRKKVRTILNQIEIPKEMGVIIRTAGLNKTKNEIEFDLNSLIKTWNFIKEIEDW